MLARQPTRIAHYEGEGSGDFSLVLASISGLATVDSHFLIGLCAYSRAQLPCHLIRQSCSTFELISAEKMSMLPNGRVQRYAVWYD